LAGLNLNTTLFPYRTRLNEKNPMELTIELKNETNKAKMVSLSVKLPSVFALDKTGLNKTDEKKIKSISPGETKKIIYSIYSMNYAEAGVYSGKITVHDHFNNYDYLLGTISKELVLKIIE